MSIYFFDDLQSQANKTVNKFWLLKSKTASWSWGLVPGSWISLRQSLKTAFIFRYLFIQTKSKIHSKIASIFSFPIYDIHVKAFSNYIIEILPQVSDLSWSRAQHCQLACRFKTPTPPPLPTPRKIFLKSQKINFKKS